MKKLLCLVTSCFSCFYSFAQNVGIGTSTPTKGRLEVVGVAGGGNTNAIFGSSVSGISLQQNWPTIGFNQYRDTTVGNGKYMTTGYAALQTMNPDNGVMLINMLGTGQAGSTTVSGSRAITILPNGNVGIKNDGGSASLTVSRGTGTDGTAVFQGTTNWSHFNYGTTEDTYIRAGKDNSDVIVNDVNNGDILLGAASNNFTAVRGGFGLSATAINVNANYKDLTVGKNSYFIITPTDNTNPRITLTNGTRVGQLLIIQHFFDSNDPNGWTFNLRAHRYVDPNNTLLAGDHTFGPGDMLT